MKIFLSLICLFFSIPAMADVYVVYDKNTKDVISVSNENDCVVDSSMKLEILEMDLADVVITMPPTFYKWQGKFVPNMDKLKANEQEEIMQEEMRLEANAVKEFMANKAIADYEASGKTLKHKEHVKEKLND